MIGGSRFHDITILIERNHGTWNNATILYALFRLFQPDKAYGQFYII